MHSDSLHTDNNWNNWFHFQYDRLWPVNMTGKMKSWLVNSPISPDIVRWPAVISSPALEDSSCYGIDIYIESVEVVDDISSRCWLFVGNIGLLTPTQPYTFFIEFVVSLYIAVIFTCCKMYLAYAICTRKCRKIVLMYNLFFTNVCGSLLCSFFLPVSSTNYDNCSVTYMLKFAHSSKSTELC